MKTSKYKSSCLQHLHCKITLISCLFFGAFYFLFYNFLFDTFAGSYGPMVSHLFIFFIFTFLSSSIACIAFTWVVTSQFHLPLLKPRKFQDLVFWNSLSWSSLISVILLFYCFYFAFNLTSTPKSDSVVLTFISIFFGLLLSIWGMFITYFVMIGQNITFNRFDSFLRKLSLDLEEVLNKKNGEILIFDYHPYIGVISSETHFNNFLVTFKEAIHSDKIKITVLSFGTEEADRFIESLSSTETKVKYHLKNKLREGLELLRSNNNNEIWFSDDIGPLHFIVIDHILYQYTIRPKSELNSNINTIVGSRSEDVLYSTQFKETFSHLASLALKPEKIEYISDKNSFRFYLTPQYDIAEIHITCDTKEFKLQDNNIEKKAGVIYSFEVPEEAINGCSLLSYKLTKENTRASFSSTGIKTIDLFKLTRSKLVKYLFIDNGCDITSEIKKFQESFKEDATSYALLKCTIFCGDIGLLTQASYIELQQMFGEVIFNFVNHKPMYFDNGDCKYPSIAVEMTFIDTRIYSIKSGICDDVRYAIITNNEGVQELHFAINPNNYDELKRSPPGTDIYKNTLIQSLKVMRKVQFGAANVVRHWHFVGEILSLDSNNIQNYQRFNQARSNYFKCNGINKKYPAASALDGGGICYSLEVVAMKGTGCSADEINSVLQNNSDSYSDAVLPGDSAAGKGKDKARPLFSRAFSVSRDNKKWLYISGTAAIKGEKSQTCNPHDQFNNENITKQTEDAIENFIHILSTNTAYKLNSLSVLDYLRIHIKPGVDPKVVNKIIAPELNGIPHIYLLSDICRDELLIELDGSQI